ncbi:MAG TPA: lysylphosphatidylglycerol synthase domain-containing protein [Gemmatimonadales bacterium]|nr:lysylphosphatidylglycerol synthase domain-containing protein [Gemmatimonadales bacterium]
MSEHSADAPRWRLPFWAVRAARLLALAAVLWLAWSLLSGQWSELRSQPLELSPRWGMIAASCGVVLLTYALLVELWRRLLRTWEQELAVIPAARVWFVSSLGRYVPGRVWQIGAMAVLARREGVSAVAATGSAVINTVVNIAAGMVVAVLTGASLLDQALVADGAAASSGGLQPSEVALLLAGAGFIALLLLPWFLPLLSRVLRRLTSREFELPAIDFRILWILVAGHLAGWALYGIAFRLLTVGLLGSVTGASFAYIAVFTASYIVGYLALLTPGGLVVREVAMIAALTGAGLTTPVEASAVAIASRIWLTGLEVLPGATFLAVDSLRSTSHRIPPDSVP